MKLVDCAVSKRIVKILLCVVLIWLTLQAGLHPLQKEENRSQCLSFSLLSPGPSSLCLRMSNISENILLLIFIYSVIIAFHKQTELTAQTKTE